MKYHLFIFIHLWTSLFYSQNEVRGYEGLIVHEDYLEIETTDGSYRLTAYNDQIIETSFIPEGEKFDPNSHAVIGKKIPQSASIIDGKDTIYFQTNGIRASIVKDPFQIRYTYKNQLLTSERRGYMATDSTEILEFNLKEEEVLYGGGSRALGMNRRGNRLELYNKAHYGYENRSELLNYTLPIVLSSKKYMLHFDNASIGFLDLDSRGDQTVRYETVSGRKTYQVIAGANWSELLDSYTDLTGKQPMPPRWIFGNFASRFGYHSQKEVENVVTRFKKDRIPLDAIVLDIYWFGKDIKGHMGNFEFLKDSFPKPKEMIDDFQKEGIKTILVTEPFILSTSKNWNDAIAKDVLAKNQKGEPYQYDFYFGNTGLIDIFKPEAKHWFWNIYKKFTMMGVAGWWGDLGEPEVHPLDMQHAVGSANTVHNVYGHHWAEILQEGYKKDFPKQRPFILMRSGAAGSQRFGLIPWSGDVSRSWGGLQVQPEIALQMGMQGLGYMHADLGGFAGGERFDSELYTRWLQYGVFQPVFRPHGQEHIAAEPVFHDDETKALAKKAIELRYQLLPYNYTLAFENHTKGIPLMRPLLFLEPENNTVLENSQTYLWGNDFLVTPITEANLSKKEIYFPKDNDWIDFYTEKVYQGGQNHVIPIVRDHIPVFVRAGSFVPMAKLVQTTANYNLEEFNLHFYAKETTAISKSLLYHDDGKTPNAFERGCYELITCEAVSNKRKTVLTISKKVGSQYKSVNKRINLIIHKLTKMPSKISVGGTKVIAEWNENKKQLTVPIHWNSQNEAITIQFH